MKLDIYIIEIFALYTVGTRKAETFQFFFLDQQFGIIYEKNVIFYFHIFN